MATALYLFLALLLALGRAARSTFLENGAEVDVGVVPTLDLRELGVAQSVFNTSKIILLFLYNDDNSSSSSFKLKYDFYISLLHPLQARWKEVLTFYLCPKSTCASAVLSVFYLKLKNLPRAVIHDLRSDLKFVQPPNGHIPPIGAGNAHISMKTLEEFIFNSICKQEDSSHERGAVNKLYIEELQDHCESLPTMEFPDEDTLHGSMEEGDSSAGYYSKENIRASRRRLKIDMYGNYINDEKGSSNLVGDSKEFFDQEVQNEETSDDLDSRDTSDGDSEQTTDFSARDNEFLGTDGSNVVKTEGSQALGTSGVNQEEEQQSDDETLDQQQQDMDEHGKVFLSRKELDKMLQGIMI